MTQQFDARRIYKRSLAGAAIAGLLVWGFDAPAADPQPGSAPSPWAGIVLPNFQPGLWQFRRALFNEGAEKPQVTEVTKCTDPASDIRQKMESLSGKGCQFSRPQHADDHYVSNWVCQTPNGLVRFHDVLTANDATSYVDVSEAQMAQRITRSRLEARRLSDCPGKSVIPYSHGGRPLPWLKAPNAAAEPSNR
jgi:hypothetical protein